MAFTKATKQATSIKLAISGPSGSGKTYSALLLAKGLGGKTAVLDTEGGSASLYADFFDFDTWDELDPKGFPPEYFIRVIKAAEEAGYNNLIIDSLSHEWNGRGGCLELADAIARAKYKGNTFAAWVDVTPRHTKLIETILNTRLNILATMRAKSDYVITKDEKSGKSTPQKVGLAAIQRDGMDYEFTLMFELDRDSHIAIAGKDRTHLFSDPVLITEATGQRIAQWLTKPQPVTATVSMGMFANNLKPHFSQSQDEEYEKAANAAFQFHSTTPAKPLPAVQGVQTVSAVKKIDPLAYIRADFDNRFQNGETPESIIKDYADILKTDAQRPIDAFNADEAKIVATELFCRANPNARRKRTDNVTAQA